MDNNPYAPVSPSELQQWTAYATKQAYYAGKDYGTKRLADHEDTPQSLLACAQAYLRFETERSNKGHRFWSGVRYVAQKGIAK